MRITSAIPVGFLFLACLNAAAQSSEPVFRGEVTLRQVEVRVTGSKGEPALNFGVDDFVLEEDGVKQVVASVDFIAEPRPLPALAPGSEAETIADIAEMAPPVTPAAPLWVYLATQTSVMDYPKTNEAMERFVRQKIRDGMQVSIGGLPFTTNRADMLRTLETMRENPFGRRPDLRGHWLPPTVDVTDPTIAAMEKERSEAVDPRTEPDLLELNSRLTTELDAQIAGYNRVMLYRFLDLIRELSAYPGKKAVVLFRGGLRADVDNFYILERIAGESVRNRVSFYTVDSRGAEPILPVADGFSERQFRRLKGPTRSGRRSSLTEERLQRLSESQDGLHILANLTGGKALLSSNDFSEIFDDVGEDAGGYYLLSYSPGRLISDKTRRTVRVRLRRSGFKLSYPKAYYESKLYEDMNDDERAIELHRTLLSEEAPHDLSLRFDAGFYRDPQGRTVMVYSTAVPLSNLTKEGRKSSYRLGVAARADDPLGRQPQTLDYAVATIPDAGPTLGRPARSQQDLARAHRSIQLEPGRRRWRVIVRDEPTGRVGSFEADLDVPDLSKPSSASTILLTRLSRPVEGSESSMFEVDGRVLVPESPREFRRGDTLYIYFELYNVPDALLSNPPPFQMALLRGEQRVEGLAARSEVFRDRARSRLSFFASLQTQDLGAGDYTVFALLPENEVRTDPYLYRSFTIVP